jgi:hypothetical protein
MEEAMKASNIWSIVCTFVVGTAMFLPMARATEANEETMVRCNQPVEIPGQVLAAGTYKFVLVGDPFNRSVVRIYSADGKKVYATLDTIATERRTATLDVTITLAERPSSQPEALLNWFYPGSTIGHEFTYSKSEERELAQDKQQVVVAGALSTSNHAGL